MSNTVLLKDPMRASSLFAKWDETMILSCLQGIMGQVWADDDTDPSSAAAVLGDFCFFAGTPNKDLIQKNYGKAFLILVPQNNLWGDLIENVLGTSACKQTRYAFYKTAEGFDRHKLTDLADSLPEGYSIHPIDENRYHRCLSQSWSCDLVGNFASAQEYAKLGLGFVVEHRGEIVCGASSYSRYQEGIEIEIDTREDHRRKGLAASAAAKLMLACLDRQLYPSWDAQNPVSASLAKKLGYRFDREYPVYEMYYDRKGEMIHG